jgi:A/G-specific adenine glycosylase
MKISPKKKVDFQNLVLDYYKKNKRASLPWRKQITPYRVWISEIMLQQTQVDRVISFFNEWVDKFPTVQDLARASQIHVLKNWKGLGYNSRAIRLKRAAEILVKEYGGMFPKRFEEIIKLPGIGSYTAGAIMAFAYNKQAVFVETNIRRVFIYHFHHPSVARRASRHLPLAGEETEHRVHDKEILDLVSQTLPEKNIREWYFALMDYGAYLGRELKINGKKFNPNIKSRHYTKQSKFAGSDREIRSRIVSLLLEKKKDSISGIVKKVSSLSNDIDRIEKIISTLERDGFVEMNNGIVLLKK